MRSCAWLLIGICLLFSCGTGAAQRLSPREPIVIESTGDDPALISLQLQNESSMGELLLVVGDSLVHGDAARIALEIADPAGSWVRRSSPESVAPHRFLVAGNTTELNGTVATDLDARLLFYYDVSCDCATKAAPFPGAMLAFHANVEAGDMVTAHVLSQNGASFTAQTLDAKDPSVVIASERSTEGAATWSWEGLSPGRTFIVVTMDEGAGGVDVRFDQVAAPPAARAPWGLWVALAAVAVAAVARRQGAA